MNYILINAQTRQPVPLPFHTRYTIVEDEVPVSVYDFREPDEVQTPAGSLLCMNEQGPLILRPAFLGLALITEEDFMKEQSK